jgi:DNA polymerase-1
VEKKKLFLLDGHALVYRAHYAFINRPLINSKGVNTSAITGFVRTLWDLMTNQKPSHLAVVFDPKGGTFRNDIYPEYKANRDATPEDITIAIPYIKDILEAMNVHMLVIDNYEADDVIGTLSKKAEKAGFVTYMVTPDKDYAQLVSDNIFMYKPSRSGNGVDILGPKEIKEKWDIQHVDQVIDMLGLQGDSVDNIPGVPGIGPKTAAKLLKVYNSLEKLLESTDDLKGKQKENLINFAEQGRLSKLLATIKLDVPVEFDEKKLIIEEINKPALKKVFQELEFRSLARQILGEDKAPGEQQSLFQTAASSPSSKSNVAKVSPYKVVSKNIETVDHTYHVVHPSDKPAVENMLKVLNASEVLSFDTETTGIDANQAELVGLVFSIKAHEAYYVPISADQKQAKTEVLLFKDLLENENTKKIGQNIKYDILIMKWYGVHLKGPLYDTMIAHYLCEPDLRHKLDYLSEAYLDYKMVPIEELIGKRGKNQLSMRDVSLDKVARYAGEDADITLQVKDELWPKLKELDIEKVYDDIEAPLIQVLAQIEYEGVRIDSKFLKDYSIVLGSQILEAEKEIYAKAGVNFNIASPKQVGEVLFDRLKIPYRWRKTSSGQYSTNVEKLNELSVNHEIVSDILQFRKFSKLKSTYVDALPRMVNPRSGMIHSSFNQARAATGRLSSENPNLQNIPIKNEAGREIRKAFIPRGDDYTLLAADYSQIELRIIAEISKDKYMLDAFLAGQDFHRATAARVYEVDYDSVTAEQRRNAKTVNFSIIYGAGATNLSRQLGIKRTEATSLIENYFKQFSGLRQYMDDSINQARTTGYVNTLLGRKRLLRDINSRNGLARSNAERMAINTPIQGTAADLIKLAMIDIHDYLQSNKLKSKMIMQVHDELVFDAHKDELDQIRPIIKEKMQNAITGLKVPIVVEMDMGNNWLEAH